MRAVLVGMMLAWRAACLQRSHGCWRASGLQQRAARSSVAAAPPQNIAAAPPQPIADASEPAFRAWLDESLRDAPRRDVYGGIYDECADAVVRWRRRYHGNPQLWKRLMKERLVKELSGVAHTHLHPNLSHAPQQTCTRRLEDLKVRTCARVEAWL